MYANSTFVNIIAIIYEFVSATLPFVRRSHCSKQSKVSNIATNYIIYSTWQKS